MRILSRLVMLCLVLLITPVVFAEGENMKHPRVIELESTLSGDAAEFLRNRVPNRPVMLTVTVEAIRNKVETERGGESANLPYFDQFEEEVLDQWDDPKVPVRALMAKCRRILISASVGADLSSDELIEIKQSLFQRLGLTVGRDQVELIRRDWAQDKKGGDIWILALIGGTVGVALIGLFIILYSSMGRLVKALPKAGSAADKSGGGGGVSAPVSAPMSEDVRRSSSGEAPTGDLKFSDPIRLKEFMTKSIQNLIEVPTFPSLEDMLQFERLAASSPGTLGALLSEFPIEKQKQVFSMSFSNSWLEGFHSPGELDNACLDVLHKIFRRNRANEVRKIEDLLIAVWRLEYKLETFIRSLPQDEAFSILGRLPKSIAVAAARAAFPGSWGGLLDPGFQPKALSEVQVKKLTEAAHAQVPLRNFQLIETYKHDRELLEFLRVSDPAIEKDIYVASPSGSLIHELRPPFYRVLELSLEDIRVFAPQVSLDEWALAMMNLPKPQRRELEKTFNEKQRFMFIERLKHYDAQQPDKAKVGNVRDRIAWKFHDFSQKRMIALAEQTAAGAPVPSVQESDAA